MLIKTLLDRAEGALLINGEGIDHVSQAEEMVKLATAVAHLIGGGQLDHLLGLADVIDPFAVDKQRAFRAIEQCFDQQRLQLIATQIVEDLADLEA